VVEFLHAADRLFVAPIAIGSAGTSSPAESPVGLAVAAAQFAGVFAGETVLLEASHDGSTWFPLLDRNGAAVSATSAARFEISTAATFVRVRATAPTAVVVNVTAWDMSPSF